MKSTLAQHTLDLVRQRRTEHKMTLSAIAEGAGVEYEWLRKFAYGKINPDRCAVANVEAVYKFLTKKTLEL